MKIKGYPLLPGQKTSLPQAIIERNCCVVLLQINNLLSISHMLDENFSMSIIDRNGIITYVNQKFCELTKYSEEELIGEHYTKLDPENKLELFVRQMMKDLATEKVYQRKLKRVTKDGYPYWIQATIVPIFDENHKIMQFISFDIDITTRIHTEKKYQNMLIDFHNIENALNQSSVVAITNRRGILTYVNDKFCELSKYTNEELIGQTHRIVNSGYHPKSFFKEMWRTIGTGGIWRGDVKNRAKDGSEYWVNTTIVPFLDEKGKPYQYIAIRTDITDRKEAEHALQIALKNDFRQTVKNLQNAIFKYTNDEAGNISFTLIEGQLAKKFGITTERFASNEIKHSFLENEIHQFRRYLQQGLQGHAIHFELNYFQYTYIIYLSPIFEGNRVIEVVGTVSDISERKEAEKLVEQMAYYDFLTALPNRRFFQQKVEAEIKKSHAEAIMFGILFLDLDHFKHINDTFGHAIGDQLLVAVGERLNNCIRKKGVVARNGGDEFVILLPCAQPSELEIMALQIVEAFAKPFILEEIETFTSLSMGISIFPKDGNTYDILLKNADSAMYAAKDKGKNTYHFFNHEIEQTIVDKPILEEELRQALLKKQFVLYYQPQIHLETGKIIGVETLIRWQHPEQGIISPASFISIAEETGLIVQIGQWVLETACAQAKAWQREGFPPLRMNINVSIRQFNHPAFVSQVVDVVEKTKLQPEYVNLEITESMTSDIQHCQLVLQQLRDIGINISIDDFGTGYSSLSYLSKLPITHLKIDQAFIQELTTSNQAIVKTIIDLAKNLNLSVTAEGVETKEQHTFLQELQCDEVQGYFYSKPVPTENMHALFKSKGLISL